MGYEFDGYEKTGCTVVENIKKKSSVPFSWHFILFPYIKDDARSKPHQIHILV